MTHDGTELRLWGRCQFSQRARLQVMPNRDSGYSIYTDSVSQPLPRWRDQKGVRTCLKRILPHSICGNALKRQAFAASAHDKKTGMSMHRQDRPQQQL